MANSYDRGDTIRITGTFVASGNNVVDVPSAYLLIRSALGSVGTYGYIAPGSSTLGVASIAKATAGCYYADFVPSCNPPAGVWSYRWDSGGIEPQAAAGEGAFYVKATLFL